jgi:hypothetical protein
VVMHRHVPAFAAIMQRQLTANALGGSGDENQISHGSAFVRD